MGTTRESSSFTDAAELEELRRRAYAPEADIGTDPVAIARLFELESALGHGVVPATPAQLVANSAVVSPAGRAPSLAEYGRTTAPPGRNRRSAVVAAVTAALMLATVGSILSGGSSEVTLYQRLEVPSVAATQLTEVGQLDYLGIAPADVQLYDHYRGLNVWSAPRGNGTNCLFVTSMTPPRWRVDCTAWDGRPTIDLLQYREDSRLAGFEALGDVPQGHVLRLTLQDGAVAVRIVEAPSPVVRVP